MTVVFYIIMVYLKVGFMLNDTIAGISTAVGNAGISVLRLSGPDAFAIADKIFIGKNKVKDQPSHTLQYGKIISPGSGEIIDEVLLTKMAAPRTYTREDVVEINCHGGYVTAVSILNLLFQSGARPAEPGEFTKRAFLNGRIDLSQAEAVMDIIQAKTERVSKTAVKQLEGSLSDKINEIREKLINILANLEVNLDYPEYDEEEVTAEMAKDVAGKILGDLDDLINTFRFGKILREGMEVVIAGRPNVGKSSLMNRLARKNRSIVTNIPGTTRDIIEEYINIKGIPVKLVDTAGVRDTSDIVEKLGVERSLKAIKDADFAVVLIDASDAFCPEDMEILRRVNEEKKPNIIVINKIDLIDSETLQSLKARYPEALFLSVSHEIGIEALEDVIVKYATENNEDLDNMVLVTNARHEHQIRKARGFITSAIDSINNGLTLDTIAMDLRAALDELGRITGHVADEDVINAIFSRFCVGK